MLPTDIHPEKVTPLEVPKRSIEANRIYIDHENDHFGTEYTEVPHDSVYQTWCPCNDGILVQQRLLFPGGSPHCELRRLYGTYTVCRIRNSIGQTGHFMQTNELKV